MLEVRLLGRFEVRLDGDPIDLASRPAQSLLAYLALNPNVPHRREKLAGLLWPDTSDANARNSLRHALWTLRRALGTNGKYLLADDLTITLNADSDCRFDFAVLDQKPSGDWSADDLIGIASEYGGDLLPGFYDEWVVLERQRLQVVFEHKMKLLLDRLVEARRWEDVLEWGERWIVLGYTPEPAYRALMIAHAGMSDLSKMAATYRRCVDALKNELGVEPSEQTRTAYERLARGEAPPDRIAMPATQPAIAMEDMPPAPGEPPFKGLQYFDEADADLFFGRERLTAKLVSRLRESNFLAVVGASGSGKSSMVRAGLLPALQRGELLIDSVSPPEGSARWLYHVITPTSRPLEALAVGLTRDAESVTATATLMDDLTRDPRSLHLFVRRRLGTQGNSRNSGNSGVLSPTSGGDRVGNHLLLVVDQFEELFTLCRDEAERKAFIDNLLTATVPPVPSVPSVPSSIPTGEGPTIVVIALRADFYAHCAEHAALRDTLAKHQEYIGRMSAEELRRAIEEPAKRGGWTFEPGLVDLLMRETGSEPGGLPLLSHALLETWQRRRGRTLTLRSYAESGGVHGAIAKTAESVYQRFTPEQQAIARSVFIRLTELGEGTQDTRRRAALNELTSRPDDVPDVGSVLNILADARLVTLTEETAEVAHEALIREWPTLRQWLSEDREGLRQHRHLTEAAREWEALGRDPGELYRGARLAQAVEWAETHAGELNALERAYLDASREWAEREAAEREAQRQRELEAARTLAETQAQAAHRLRLRNRVITAIGVIALILAVLAGVFGAQSGQNAEEARRNLGVAEEQRGVAVAAQATAEAERQRAETERRLAASRELAVLANSTLETDPELSILLALQALATTHTKQAEEALHRALQTSRIQRTLVGHTDIVEEVAYSPDGTLLATSGYGRTVRIWDIATGQERLTLPVTGDWSHRIAFHNDGTRLATLSPGKNLESLIVTIWDVVSGRELSVHTLPVRLDQYSDYSISPDWRRLIVGFENGTAEVWDISAAQKLLTLSGHDDWLWNVDFSPDGTRLITSSRDGVVKIWTWDASTATAQELRSFGPSGDGAELVGQTVSPNGQYLALGYDTGLVQLWDMSMPEQPPLNLAGHERIVQGLAFSPDGARVATGSQDGLAKVWDVATGENLFTLAGHHGFVGGLAFSPDATHLATASSDGAVRIWDANTAGGGEWLTLASGQRIHDVDLSPDEQRLALGSRNSPATVWDINTGELLLTLSGDAGGVYRVDFSPDGTQIATAGADNVVRVWDADTGETLLAFSGHGEGEVGGIFRGTLDVSFSPDGTRLATAGTDGVAKVWDAATGGELLSFTGHTEGLTSLAFSPDGARIATASDEFDTTVKVWDALTGEELFTLSGHPIRVWGLAFSPDGSRLATAGTFGVVKVWDMKTGEELYTLPDQVRTVLGVAFSPDGGRLVTGGGEATRIWDTATGEEVITLSDVGDNWIALSADGKRLFAGSSQDGVVRVFVLPLGEAMALARSRVTRALTTEECQRFLHVEQCP